jgi:hypothetical protein
MESFFKLEAVEGAKAKRIVLVEKAAQRLDIQTAEVLEDQVVRKRTIGGRVTEIKTGDSSTILVRVRFVNENELNQVDRTKQVTIVPLTDANQQNTLTAQKVDLPTSGDSTVDALAFYYKVDDPTNSLKPGQRVLVDLVMKGSGTQQKMVPYASVIYDLNGDTWVYTSPESLAFVRNTVKVDYIDGDQVILTEGPAKGTKVVTVGVAELYGIEFGIGK